MFDAHNFSVVKFWFFCLKSNKISLILVSSRPFRRKKSTQLFSRRSNIKIMSNSLADGQELEEEVQLVNRPV